MSHDLNLYNTNTLQELYAVSYWKAYKVWPRYSHSIPKSKAELIADREPDGVCAGIVNLPIYLCDKAAKDIL